MRQVLRTPTSRGTWSKRSSLISTVASPRPTRWEVVPTGVCGHPRGQRRSLTGLCEPSAWCGIWYLTYFVVQSISTPHQPYENTEDRQAGRQDNAKNLCDTKY